MRIPNNEIKLVIFDKDGTLIDNTLMFGNWTLEIVKNLSEIFPELLHKEKNKPTIWKHLGYDNIKNEFDGDSIVAKGSNDDIRNAICDYVINIRKLVECNNEKDHKSIVQMIREIWFDIKVTKDTIKQCGDVHGVFNFLHMNNIKIAICTCDDRKPTEECLKILNIHVNNPGNGTYINDLICGNDMIANKPAPDPLLKICKNLNIKPENAMMVGDTISDIHAGINAKFGRVVGVLSGGYKNVNLNEADTIIPNINSIIKIFPDSCCNKQK
jgi:phosphoglycolate phosphatase-like HAD superfamily hydrolase